MTSDNDKNLSSSKAPSSSKRKQNPFEQLKALLLPKKQRRPLRLTEDHILSILIFRRGRAAVFGTDLFSDPAWDILLELYAAELGGRSITLRELAQAVEVPASTVGRWLAALENRGVVKSVIDPADPARVAVTLTAEGASKMASLADHWGSAFVSI